MTGKVPKIVRDENAQGKPVQMTEELKQFLIVNKGETVTALANTLHLSRDKVRELLGKYADVPKKETKRQKAARHLGEDILAHADKMNSQEKRKAVRKAAKELIKSGKTMLDRLQEPVKGKDGQPLNYNGEELSTEAMMDISLINMGKDNPQANLYVRAQAMAIRARQEEEELQRKSKALIKSLTPKIASRKKRMRKALEDYGLWSGMMETTLDSWADAFMNLEVAKMQWREKGMPNVETHITAQAQVQHVPSQYKEAVNRAQKLFNECDQKLSTALSKYQRITGRSEEDDSFLSEMMKGLQKI